MGEIIIFLAGEILGDATFFLSKYPKANTVPVREREFRYYMLMPLVSIIISIAAIGSCLFIQCIAVNILRWVGDSNPDLTSMWLYFQYVGGSAPVLSEGFLQHFPEGVDHAVLGAMSNLKSIGLCFQCVESAPKELADAVLGAISNLTSMWLYMILYRNGRNAAEEKCVNAAKVYYSRHKGFLKIYVLDGFSDGYVLSERWQNVLENVERLIIVNMLLMAVLHNENIGLPIRDVFHMDGWELVPVACTMVLFEISYYLGGDVFQKWSWHLRKWMKKKPEVEMNLPYLRARFQGVGLEDGNHVCIEPKHHELEMREERRKYMGRYAGAENDKVQYFYTYLKNRVVQKYYHIHCIDTTVKLLLGENIFIATPFYHDIDICIFFPAYMSLLKNEKVLVLMEDTGKLEETARWIKEGIEEIQDLADLWNVDVISTIADNTDVGLMAFQDIYMNHNFEWQKAFFDRVSFVIVIEASNILLGGQDAVAHWARKIGHNVPECRWLLCDQNAESMVDLFSHLLNKEFAYVSATPFYARDAVIAYWNAEREPMKTWLPVQRYMGVESRIVEVAARENVQSVVWYGEECMPIYDLKWIMGQYYEQYSHRTNDKPFQSRLDDHIICDISGNGCEVQKEQFLIVEDDRFDLYEVGRQYATRAEEKVFVNVISPNYMLRNFMKEKKNIMNADPKWIAQFVPEYVNSRRNIILRLIRKLLDGPVGETEIRNMLAGDEDRADDAVMVLDQGIKNLVATVLETGNFDINVNCHTRFSEQTGRMEPELYYEIASEEIFREMNGYFCQASYIDEEGNKNHISKMMLAGHLDQKYQVGQYVVLDGKYYEIMGKTVLGYEQSLLVKRASEQITGRKYYRQNRRYHIENPRTSNRSLRELTIRTIYSQEGLVVRRYCANITADIWGYVEMDGWNHIAGGREVCWRADDQRRSKRREYRHKQILEIKLTFDENAMPFLPVNLAALFSEIFCTLYPQYYHLLSVAVNRKFFQEKNNIQAYINEGDSIHAILNYVLADIQGGRKNCFYILEDSREDMGLLRSIERNFQRILGILKRYVQWSEAYNDSYFEFRR